MSITLAPEDGETTSGLFALASGLEVNGTSAWVSLDFGEKWGAPAIPFDTPPGTSYANVSGIPDTINTDPEPSRTSRSDILGSLEVLRQTTAEGRAGDFDALPMSRRTFDHARRFLGLLPAWVTDPEVSVDPDGEVSLEWYHGPRAVFSVTIGESGTLYYAGLFGRNKTHGAESFSGDIPQPIALNLARVSRETGGL